MSKLSKLTNFAKLSKLINFAKLSKLIQLTKSKSLENYSFTDMFRPIDNESIPSIPLHTLRPSNNIHKFSHSFPQPTHTHLQRIRREFQLLLAFLPSDSLSGTPKRGSSPPPTWTKCNSWPLLLRLQARQPAPLQPASRRGNTWVAFESVHSEGGFCGGERKRIIVCLSVVWLTFIKWVPVSSDREGGGRMCLWASLYPAALRSRGIFRWVGDESDSGKRENQAKFIVRNFQVLERH